MLRKTSEVDEDWDSFTDWEKESFYYFIYLLELMV